MKKVKKIISVVLSLIFGLSALPAAFASDSNAGLPLQTFSGVDDGYTYSKVADASGWRIGGTTVAVVSSDGANKFVEVSNTNNAAEFINTFTAMDASVQAVEVSFKIRFCDKNSDKQIRLRNADGKVVPVTFTKNGKVKAGATEFMSYNTDTWYDVIFAYDNTSDSAALKITDGGMSFTAIGNPTDESPSESRRTCINRIDFYSASTGNADITTKFSVDDIMISARSKFIPQYAQSFDNTVELKDNRIDRNTYEAYNDGWYMQNSKSDYDTATFNATAEGESIDGRKALKLTADGTTYFEVVKNFIAATLVRYEFDFRCDTSNEIRFCVGGVDKDNTPTVKGGNYALRFYNGQIQDSKNNTLANISLGTWYRVALEFDYETGTYTAKIVNLSDNTLCASSSASIPAGLVDITTVKYYFPQKPGTMYIDNVVYGGIPDFALTSADVTDIDAAKGVDFILNRGVDPSSTDIAINGENTSYTLDANGLCTLNIGYLNANTSYNITYTIADMYGDTITDTLTFTTGEKGYGLTQLAISDEELKPGTVSASVNGRLYKDKEAQLIIALYSTAGLPRLEKINIVNIYSNVEDKTYSVSIDVPDDGQIYSVKAFLWDGYTPLLISESI